MFSFRTLALSVAALTLTAGSIPAAWNNVFQLTCNDSRPRTSFFTRDCAPQPERRVEYVQRTYYQPITEYKRETYRVPIKETVKSYYWEPVESYSYTSYYDPCSKCCQEIAVPRTSYTLREKCNSVDRMVEKTRIVPVQTYREVTESTPVVSYYYPPTRRYSSNRIPVLPSPLAPRVEELRTVPPSIAPQGNGGLEMIQPPDVPSGSGSSYPRPMPPAKEPSTSKSSPMNANTASRDARLRGEVVEKDQLTPKAGTKLVFVNAANHDERKYTIANDFGEFDTKLPAGDWYLYVGQADGQAVRYKKLTIGANENREFKLVSR